MCYCFFIHQIKLQAERSLLKVKKGKSTYFFFSQLFDQVSKLISSSKQPYHCQNLDFAKASCKTGVPGFVQLPYFVVLCKDNNKVCHKSIL